MQAGPVEDIALKCSVCDNHSNNRGCEVIDAAARSRLAICTGERSSIIKLNNSRRYQTRHLNKMNSGNSHR
jgi:recombinational DNA repair protein RecR